ncbi:MAG: hypothetical protein J5697_01500 [Clostridia bacterium]|nr:hypothetical protein [Clostridia bacterium]
MKEGSEDSVKDALKKKAFGYDTEETVEEFAYKEGEEILAKKKVTKKNVPPDITAIKMLLEEDVDLSEMTDEELEKEKIRLLKLLEKMNIKGETKWKEK